MAGKVFSININSMYRVARTFSVLSLFLQVGLAIPHTTPIFPGRESYLDGYFDHNPPQILDDRLGDPAKDTLGEVRYCDHPPQP